MNASETTFQPSEHLMNLGTQSKPRWYLPVQWRLAWLREAYPDARISTELVHIDLEQGHALFKAVITCGEATATGHGSETIRDFKDFIEKAETKAIGRALAALGYGTQFAPELDEGTSRIVDAPVCAPVQPRKQPLAGSTEPGSCTEQQKAALRRLTGNASMDFSEISQLQAAQAIRDLQQEQRSQQKAS